MTEDYKTPAGAPPDWRGLCEELADALDHNRQCLMDDRSLTHPLADRARAALAQPVADPTGPTDEELLELWKGWNLGWDPQKGTVLMPHPVEYARAVLARWGNHLAIPDSSTCKESLPVAPAPPGKGEVAELVEFLRIYGDEVMDEYGDVGEHDMLTRAAELLEQRHPTPVPVAERLPGAEDCDAEGRCWWGLGESDDYEACWTLRKMHGIPFDNTRWLPATALPVPGQGEI